MNEFLKVFEFITESTISVQNNPGESSELKQSATELNQSIQSCTEELRQSAARLKELMAVSYKHLYHAEDVWNSKARIMSVPTSELWEEIGKLAAIDFRIRDLQKKCQTEVIQDIKNLWLNQCEQLQQEWFRDSKNGNLKKELGFSDKDGLIQGLDKTIKIINKEMISLINNNLGFLSQTLSDLNFDSVQNIINLLDFNERANISVKPASYSYQKNYLINTKGNHSNFLSEWIKLTWSAFLNQRLMVISRGRFDIFVNRVKEIIEENMASRFSECFDFALATTTELINFYNDFLEKQNRYEQETPEQREAEKAWIDQQRQKLDDVQKQINIILNQS
ncbi:hypothetical protein PCC9214_02387 [Planktothrix tepida]|uniref:Dynamin family protein n=1 Tax=Planktothrix tepida PCC 9214 TaxID=671072 RepID=A0A1J1LIQ7_9CYAN|nr:hypothetical protein [Planktothrix tepida]CAD5948308.1 hypothetical protein PCC9214_02387 [Planktothrix tepida]CUR31906.1 conserved hypothetical protein [Planktothrix tepida PCC 9214]